MKMSCRSDTLSFSLSLSPWQYTIYINTIDYLEAQGVASVTTATSHAIDDEADYVVRAPLWRWRWTAAGFINITYTQRCAALSAASAAAAAVYKDLCGICGIRYELFSWPPHDYLDSTWLDDIFKLVFRGFTTLFLFYLEGAKKKKKKNTFMWGSIWAAVLINYAGNWNGMGGVGAAYAICHLRDWTMARYVYDA